MSGIDGGLAEPTTDGDVMPDAAAPRLLALRRLHALIRRLNADRDLATTLQAVVDGVVEGLGFGVAVVNLVRGDSVDVVAVAGSESARAELLGQRCPLASWERMLAVAQDWGDLRFVHHDDFHDDEGLPTWVPDLEVPHDPGAWHPLDALFAPLHSADGTFTGVLSVDLPYDGRIPGPLQRDLLAMFAVQAGIAVENAVLVERLRAEHQRLVVSEQSFRTAFEGAPDGMSLIGLQPPETGRFLRVNAALCQLLGYRAEELLAMGFADVTHPEDRQRDLEAMDAARAGSAGPYLVEKRYLTADGQVVWVSLRTTVVRDDSGEALYAISQARDVTAQHARTEELTHQARHDPLTGLANRIVLRERLAGISAAGRHDDVRGALLFCDLDGFKGVNDDHGHAAGDRVLTAVASRLAAAVRAGDLVARLGGDEFVVVAESMGEAGAVALADRIIAAVSAPVSLGTGFVCVGVSIGIVVFDEPPPDGEVLVAAADSAMYAAKAGGPGRFEFAPGPSPRLD